MIERRHLYHIPYYNKAVFTGSYLGMHYKLAKLKGTEEQPDTLLATAWPGPYCCDATPDEKKITASFAFSEDGIAAACEWFNKQYEEHTDLYKNAHI